MKKLFAVLMLVFLAAAMVGLPVSSFAQDSSREERITLSPAVYRPEFKAGDVGASKITIINDGQTDYDVVLYARPFSVTNEAYDPDYTEVNERTQAYQWIQLETTRISLKAGASREVQYEINVPANAASGGHYAVLFAETQPAQDGSNVARKKRVGSLIYMTVAGTTIQEGSITTWLTKLLQTKPPLESTLKVKNSGNVHFQADVTAQYSNIFGKKQFELKRELIILPGTTRLITVSWEKPPYFGIFRASGSVKYLDKTEELSSHWVILLPQPVIIGLVVVVAGAFGYALLRRRKKKGNKHENVSKKTR